MTNVAASAAPVSSAPAVQVLRVLSRIGMVCALASLLGACSGGDPTPAYDVSVAVSGLSGTIVVALGSSKLTFTADGTNTFARRLGPGASYSVTVQTQPPGQYCAVANGTGTASGDVTVNISCNDSVGGVWGETSGNDSYFAMADEMGDFWMLDYNQSASYEYLYVGNLNVNDTAVTGSVGAVSLLGTFSDGSTWGTGSLSGTINPRNALDFTDNFTTAMNTTSSTTLSLSYGTLYGLGSSMANVAGNYTEQLSEGGTTESVPFTISDSGVIYSQDPGSGCVRNGTVTLINSNYDMYHVQYTYGDCAGNDTVLNGLAFNGIAALFPATSSSPALLAGAATAPSGNSTYYTYFVVQRN